MEIKVNSPDYCPLRFVDAEGYIESACRAISFPVEAYHQTRCDDDDKFPLWCPLLKENVVVTKE